MFGEALLLRGNSGWLDFIDHAAILRRSINETAYAIFPDS